MKSRAILYLLAALVPGSCSTFFFSETYFYPTFSVSPDPTSVAMNVVGFASFVYFGLNFYRIVRYEGGDFPSMDAAVTLAVAVLIGNGFLFISLLSVVLRPLLSN